MAGVTCSNPGPLAGGIVRPNRQSYEVGQTITYVCDVGYKIKGQSSSICKDDGEWTNPLPDCISMEGHKAKYIQPLTVSISTFSYDLSKPW